MRKRKNLLSLMILLKNDSIHMRWTKGIYTSIEKYYQKLHAFLYVILLLYNNFFLLQDQNIFYFNLKRFVLVRGARGE